MSQLITPEANKLMGLDGKPLANSEYRSIKVPNIRIVGPRLLVLPAIPVDEMTESGLHIPASARDVTQKGVVLIVGDGVTLQDGSTLPPNCEVGDEIIFARYSGTSLKLDHSEYLIIQESDVRAVLTFRGKVFQFTED